MNKEFERDALGRGPSGRLLGCEGDDLGNPDAPSIWIYGMEPGGHPNNDEDNASINESVLNYSIQYQLDEKWRLNKNVFKLLASIDGHKVSNYEDYAYGKQPFVRGERGFYKGNLYPLPCQREECWPKPHIKTTGFSRKQDYRDWCYSNRFPVISHLTEKHRPKLFIGLGLGNQDAYWSVTGVDRNLIQACYTSNNIGGTRKYYVVETLHTKVAVIPHLSGARPTNAGIQELGEAIASWIGK